MKPFNKSVMFFGLAVFENKDKIVIVMEYASRGDLYDYICDKKNISEREARHFFRQIVSAVHYCHQVRQSVSVQRLHTQDMKLFIGALFTHGCYVRANDAESTQTSCAARCFPRAPAPHK